MHVRPAPAPTDLIWTRGSNTDSLVLQPTKKGERQGGREGKKWNKLPSAIGWQADKPGTWNPVLQCDTLHFFSTLQVRKGLETSFSSHHLKTKQHFSSPAELGYRRWPPDCSGLSAGHFSDQQCTSQAFLLCRTPSPTCILPAETMALHLTILGSGESRGTSLLPLI